MRLPSEGGNCVAAAGRLTGGVANNGKDGETGLAHAAGENKAARDSWLTDSTGVVVLGHGSRAPAAGVLLRSLAGKVAERLACPVLPASLQFNRPTLEESCRQLAASGVRRIIVAPYFLFDGNHLARDIPEEISDLESALPDVEFVLAGSLGADERLAEILIGRINEAGSDGGGEDKDSPAGEASFANEHGVAAAAPDNVLKKDASERERMTDETGGSLSIEVNVAAGARRLPGHPIELESFDIIDRILAPADPDEPVYQIARRVVHTTGDPGMAGELAVSGDAVAAALSAFAAGEQIICDVNMAAAGIKPTAAKLGLEVRCLIADRQTEELAAREGITRGAAGIRRAAAELDHDSSAANGASCLKDAVVVIGNAPTALFECLRLAEDPRTRPAVIVGVPVGFVGAAESKEALMASGLPYVTLPGNRGGSNIAVAIANALMRLSDASRSGSVDSGGAGSEEKAGAGSEEMNSCEQKEES